jgi:hypothetical protein
MTMSEMAKQNETVLTRDQRLLPCALTETEITEKARMMARILDDQATAEADEAAQKAVIKERRDRLDRDLQSVGAAIRRGAEDRSVEVEVRASYLTSEIVEVRADTGAIVGRRPMNGEERQQHLFPPTSDDAYDRGRLARGWADNDPNRPEPVNPFRPIVVDGPFDVRSRVRWGAGYLGDEDPTQPFTSPHEEGLMASDTDTNPYANGTEAFARWAAGLMKNPDPVSLEVLGHETRQRDAAAVLQAPDREAVELLRRMLTRSAEVAAGSPFASAEFWVGYRPGMGL